MQVRKLVGLFVGTGLYTGSFLAYYNIMTWIQSAPDFVDNGSARFSFAIFGIVWMIITTLVLELHDAHKQGFRADITDTTYSLFEE